MFHHAYDGYLKYAYPYDELRPLSCDGHDTWGRYEGFIYMIFYACIFYTNICHTSVAFTLPYHYYYYIMLYILYYFSRLSICCNCWHDTAHRIEHCDINGASHCIHIRIIIPQTK